MNGKVGMLRHLFRVTTVKESLECKGFISFVAGDSELVRSECSCKILITN